MGEAARIHETETSKAAYSGEAEKALLGALLLEPGAWSAIESLLSGNDFYVSEHRRLFEAIDDRKRMNEYADAIVIRDHLQRTGQLESVGGADYLSELINFVPSAAGIRSYAKRVRRYALIRRLRACHVEAINRIDGVGDPDPVELISSSTQALLDLHGQARTGRGLVNAQDIAKELLDELDRRAGGEHGLSVGLPDFDRISFGLESGDLVVFAGRPGMGKTALLVSIAAHVSRTTGVAVFSAEMSAAQLMRRCIALVGSVQQGRLRKAQDLDEHDWSHVAKAAEEISRRNLWIDDTPAPRLDHVRAEALAQCSRTELGLVLVDYVQLVQGDGQNRYEQLRDVAYGLKALAKEAHLPIVLLAQLNRSVETRLGTSGKRGRLSDLRDSGAIEEAADIVGMLYSEGYYNPKFGMPYVLECAIEKNRHGERGECLWHFSGEHSRVETLDEAARAQYRFARESARQRFTGDDL